MTAEDANRIFRNDNYSTAVNQGKACKMISKHQRKIIILKRLL